MSNHLAIAAVTATLGSLLTKATSVVTGAEVSNLRPGSTTPAMPTVGINLYLFQVTPNPSWRNVDLPARDSGGRPFQRPTAALDLHYLLSFLGDETQLEPQRLLGAAVATLHANPVLSREAIQRVIDAAVAADPNAFLGRSDLTEQVDLVRLTPLGFSLDELSKLWSVFFQTPYMLSVAYVASVALVEEQITPQRGLPVRSRGLLVLPINQPVLERVIAQSGEDQPILTGSAVILEGKRLKGDTTRVLFGETEVTPNPDNVTDTEISLTLPAGLKAGVLGAQVAHQLMLGDPAAEHRGTVSNVAAFVLHPQIKQPGGVYDITFSNRAVATDGTLSGTLTIKLNPDVGKTQRVTLLLNEFQPAGSPSVYSFKAQPRTVDGDTVAFSITGIQAHTYLVRVQVDGAESALETDNNQASLTYQMYIAPTVAIV
jgi:hypothetical protein